MTLPDERSRAVKYAREFLRDLLNPKATPRIPLEIRRRARAVLKHFPADYEIAKSAEKNPNIWAKLDKEEDY